jgi:ABC-type Fe3+ transport system substrate-binding protein
MRAGRQRGAALASTSKETRGLLHPGFREDVVRRPLLFRLAALCLAMLAAAPADAAGGDACGLHVLTSYPESFYAPFVEAFSAQSNARVCVTNKNTIALIRHVRERRRPVADVIWASSPVAFSVLDTQGLLARRPDLVEPAEAFGGIAVDAPNGTRFGFALSELGVMWKPERVYQPAPDDLAALAQGRFRGRIGMSSPARSGTTHLFVETVLQRLGWRDGWALLSRLGGNLATVTARSFGVRDGVANDRFAFGVGIDFLAKAREHGQAPIAFRALVPGLLFPASAALTLAGADNPRASGFVVFLRSDIGQNLLLRPAIARIPVRTGLRERAMGERGADASTAEARADAVPVFDADLAARRLPVVAALFDEMITYRHLELAELWSQIDRLEADPRFKTMAEARALAGAARGQLEAVPVASFMSDAVELAGELGRGGGLGTLAYSGEGSNLRDSWSRDFASRFLKARELVARAGARLDEGASADEAETGTSRP